MSDPAGLPAGLPDLSHPLSIHIVGAGGAGMNAIGVVLSEMGHQVSGSDLRESLGITRLRAMGARITIGHDADNVGTVDAVVHSTAVAADNVELERARAKAIPVWRRAEILRAVCDLRRTVAVAGTHGKTTTSSMLSLCLAASGMSPSFLVGGDLNEIGSGAVWDDDGDLFVVEADESDGTFVELGAPVVLVTNIEPDHLDFHGSVEALHAAFDDFVAGTELAVLCVDDEQTAAVALSAGALAAAALSAAAPQAPLRGVGRVVSYGSDGAPCGGVPHGGVPAADYRMSRLSTDRHGVRFDVDAHGSSLGTFTLPLPGRHNAMNALGALAAALELGAEVEAVREALARFGGVARRFERRGERDGVAFVDDYAHLPTEVEAAVAAAQSGGWGRVVAVFQPHRYSRTAALWRDFADSFAGADQLVLTGIYPAGELPQPGITGELVMRAVLDSHPWATVAYLPNRADLAQYLRAALRPGDLCLTLGAGDLTTLPDELLNA